MKVSSRIVRGPIEELIDRSTGVYLPSYDETRTVVADYQSMALRRAEHKWAFADLQQHLLIAMQAEQVHIHALESATPPEAHRELYDTYVEFAKLPLLCFRRIADGMAFRFLNYDVSLMQALNRNRVGVEDLASAGVLHEMEFAAAVNDLANHSQVFHCALSDLMNVGDVIVKNRDTFEVIEVKKGQRSRGARISRQKERLSALAEFFNNHRGNLDGRSVHLMKLPARRHHLLKLEVHLEACQDSSPRLFQVSSFHVVWCCDFRSTPREEVRPLLETAEAQVVELLGRECVEIASYAQRNFVGVTVPVTVFPFSAEMIADILLGGLCYVSYISLKALIAHIELRGWRAVDVSESAGSREANGYAVLHVFKRDNPARNYSLPVDVILECGASLIDIDSVLEGFERMTEQDGRDWTLVYDDESSIWR